MSSRPAPPALAKRGITSAVAEPLPEEADFSGLIFMMFRDQLVERFLVPGEVDETAESTDPDGDV